MSAKGLVLVTGANGFIGARTVEAFLQAGYSVRGTVRNLSSASALVSALPDHVADGRLTIDEVPDITAPGAFDTALKDVTAVAHLATPVSMSNTDVDYVMKSSVKGALGILDSALKVPSMKSFVLMSSIAAIRSSSKATRWTEADWNNESEAIVKEKASAAGGQQIYKASKVAAERAFWRMIEQKTPSFSATAVNPVWVAGPPLSIPDSPDKISETNAFVWKVFAGQEYPPGPTGYGTHVDVRDVARMTVFGVEHPEIANGQRYIVGGNGNSGNPQAVADILREAYPDRLSIIKEGTPGAGYEKGWKFPENGDQVISDKAIRATGQGWISYEKMVLDTANMLETLLYRHS